MNEEVIAKFGADIQSFMAACDQMKAAMGGVVSNIQASAQSAQNTTSSFGSMWQSALGFPGAVVNGIGNVIGGIVNMGVTVGRTIFFWKQLIQTGVSFVEGLFQQAAAIEKLKAPFTQLLGGADAANTMIQELYHFAAGTPFDAPGITATAQKMLTMGFTSQEVVPIITSVANAVVGVGKGQGAIDQVINSFERMKQTGTVSMLNITALVKAGIPAWDMLAKGLGVTVPQAMEAVKTHTVNATTAIKALTDGMNKMFPGQLDASANTFAGSIKRMKEYWQEMLVAVSSPIMKALEGIMSDIANEMSKPVWGQFAYILGTVLAGALQGLYGIFKSVEDVVIPIITSFTHFATTGNNLSIALIPVRNFLSDIQGVIIGKLGPAFLQLRDWAQQIIAKFQAWIAQNGGLQGGLDKVVGFVSLLAGWLKQAYDGLVSFLGPVLSIAGSFWDWANSSGALQLALWIVQGAISAILTVVTGVATGVGAVLTWFHTGSPWAVAIGIALFTVAGAMTAIGVALLVMKIANFISLLPTIIGLGWLWVVQMWALVVPWLALNWPILLIGAAVALVVAIAILAITHWGQIMSWFGNLFAVIGQWIGDRFQWVGDRIGEVGRWIGDRFQWIGDRLGELKQWFLNLVNGVVDKWNGFVGILQGIGQSILDAITWPFRTAMAIVGGIVDTVRGWISEIGNWMGGTNNPNNVPSARPEGTGRAHAQGGLNLPPGWATIGEKGPELMYIPGGASIFPTGFASQTALAPQFSPSSLSRGGSTTIVFQVDGQSLAQALGPGLSEEIRISLGGAH